MTLSNKKNQHLKSLAHAIKPVVQLGNNGLTEGVYAESEGAIKHNELNTLKIHTDEK